MEKPSLSKTDKANIRTACELADLDITINENCPDCWRDALAQLYKATNTKPDERIVTDGGEYRYVGGVKRTLWQPYGVVMDNHTSDDVITRYIASFPNQKIYIAI